MQEFLTILRLYDFNAFYYLYGLGEKNYSWEVFFYLFARNGIVFLFLSFIYLIWNKRIKAFFCGFLAMGIAGFVDLIISIFWQRPTPYTTHANIVDPYLQGMKSDIVSFPSSHTYIAFAVATSVFLYGHKKLGSALFFLAIMLAVSRIGAGLHYPSDIIGGAILGILSGILARQVVRKLEKEWE